MTSETIKMAGRAEQYGIRHESDDTPDRPDGDAWRVSAKNSARRNGG